MAPALELGGRAGGEDPQHGALLLARVQATAREHADVADERARGVAHRHREVALEPVTGEEAVGGKRATLPVGWLITSASAIRSHGVSASSYS